MLTWLGLRARLVLLVLLSLLPASALLLHSALQERGRAFEQADARLQSQVLLVAAHQQRLLENAHDALFGLARMPAPAIGEVMSAFCGAYLAHAQAQHSELDQIGVLGLDGRPVCASESSAGVQDASEADFFQQVLAGAPVAVGTRREGAPGLILGLPMHDALGQLAGVAFAAWPMPALADASSRAVLLPGAAAVLLDPDGRVLAADPPVPAGLGRPHADAAVRQAVQALRQRELPFQQARTQELLYAFAPVPMPGTGGARLLAVLSLPQALIAAQSQPILAVELLAMLAVALCGLGCAWWMGNRLIVRPARAVLHTAEDIGRGNLSSRVGPHAQGPDEIGQIGLALNRMAETLQARQAALDAALRESERERALLGLVLNSMSEGVMAIDTESRFLLFNHYAGQIHAARPEIGSSLTEWRQGRELMWLDSQTPCPVPERPLIQALRGISLDNQELLLRSAGLPDRVLRMSTRPLYDAQSALIGSVAVFNDVTEAKAAERFALAHEEVLGLIAAGAPLPDALGAIVLLIEERLPGSGCVILRVDGARLRHGVGVGVPAGLVESLDGVPVEEGRGACAEAAFRREAVVVVADADAEPLAQAEQALLWAHGLRACWATPVIASDGQVLATLAIYRHAPGAPRPADEALIATASRLTRIALARAQAEAALVSSEARFRELAENIEDVFYNVDTLSRCVRYISPGYEKVWGRSCQSLYDSPASYRDAVLPEDRALLAQADERNRQGQPSDVAYRIARTDGQVRWVRDRSYPVFNAAGALERVVGIARDITESRRAEQALAATNRALQMLSRSCIAINRINEEESLLAEVCRVAVEVGDYRMAWVGYARDDEKKSLEPVAHAGDEGGYLDAIEISWSAEHPSGKGPAGQAIRSAQPAQRSDIGADPTFYWRVAALERGYRSSIALPLCEGGRSFGVLCLYRSEVEFFTPDEMRLLQELADNLAFGIGSLRARQERLRSQEAARQAALCLAEQASLLDHAQDAIIVRNLDRTVRFWNQGAERLYGWSAAEALGQTLEAQMYRDPQQLARAMARTLDNGGDWSGEVEQLARGGWVVHVESRCTAVRDEQGRVTGVLSINTDISERRRAHEAILSLNASLEERVRQRTAELELANQQLEAFSYSVSHDLRSPLNAIGGFSQLLEKNLASLGGAEPLAARSAHYLARIRAGVVQMGELIEAMLSLAQVSRSDLRWEAVDLSALAQGLLAGYQEREPARQARWQIEPGLMAQGDARLLKQVLDNLLGNAWKFSAGQPYAEIALERDSGPHGQGAYVVRDNGAGFDMAYADKLFSPFQRLHAQSEFAGTGIGLATVARIIERHGGKVWAESAPGQGARFYFTLGVQAAAGAGALAEPSA